MSRSSETIEEIIKEIVFEPASTIEIVSDKIAKTLIERHPYTAKIEVKLEGKIIVQVREGENRANQKAYDVSSIVKAHKTSKGEFDFNYFISGSAYGMTCCPCALGMSKEFAQEVIKNRNDIDISEETDRKSVV